MPRGAAAELAAAIVWKLNRATHTGERWRPPGTAATADPGPLKRQNADSSVAVDAADEVLEDPNKEEAEGTAILTCGGTLDASARWG